MQGPTTTQPPPQQATLIAIRAKLKNLLKYLLTGLVVALAISRLYPGFSHCLKQQKCSLFLTVMNVVVFWGTVVGWPFVLAGIVLGKLTFMLVGFMA
jgi:hypothetical protein